MAVPTKKKSMYLYKLPSLGLSSRLNHPKLQSAIVPFMYLAIVGKNDKSLFELNFNSTNTDETTPHVTGTIDELNTYIVHAALDVVDEVQWSTPNLYLKSVDKFYNHNISAFVTPGNIRFLLLHDNKSDESIKQFFYELWDIYVKTLLSPFYKEGDTLETSHFTSKVKQLHRKNL